MKILRAIVQMLVAGIFATAEAVVYIDQLRVARLWHRKQHL
ncbi:MAG TPA: hypothetical protein VHE61_19020 [Opitutaceae bacterium]|nr:hypothetical protein [Opitutaceae bacterium]